MTNRLRLLLISALGILIVATNGQERTRHTAAGVREQASEQAAVGAVSVAPPLPIRAPYPFAVGEKLTYEFSFSRFPLTGKLGELELSVVRPEAVQDAVQAMASKLRPPEGGQTCQTTGWPPSLAFQARAQTRGFLPALLGVEVRNDYLSIVDAADLGLLYNQRTLRSRRREQLQITCHERPAATRTILEGDGAMASPVNARTLPARHWTTDLQTFWYVLRTQPLRPGATIPMVLTEDHRVYDIPVTVTPEVETITTRAGRFRAHKLDLKAYESGFTRYQGTFYLWLSTDAARLPVRVRFKARGVTVTGELVHYTVIRQRTADTTPVCPKPSHVLASAAVSPAP